MGVFNKESLFFLLHLLLSINCIQTLYKLIPEHCEITHINKSLVDVNMMKCYKVSRDKLYFNSSIYLVVDILNNAMGQVKVTGYQFRSNEYRKGPIEFMMGLCSAFASKDFDIPNMFRYSNMKCPFRKAINYYVYKLSLNATNFPPMIPAGRWKIQLDLIYMNKYTIFTVEWYVAVEYPPLFSVKGH